MEKKSFEYKNSLKKDTRKYVFKYINVEKYISRPIASIIVKMVYNTKITPNHLTYLSFLISIPGIILIALGNHLNVAIGGILIYISFLIDAADGMLARSRNCGTEFGKYLDLFLDRISDFLILLSIIIYKYRMTDNKDWLIFGLFVLSLYMLQIILFYIKNMYLNRESGGSSEARGLIGFVILVLALANKIEFMLYIGAVESVIVVIYRIIDFNYLGIKNKE